MVVTLLPEAAETFQVWREEHYENQPPAGLFASHYGKLPGIVLRLALVLEFLWWAVDDSLEPPSTITESATAAAELVSGYFTPMAHRAYGIAALSENEKGARTIARWIVSKGISFLNASELRRKIKLPGLRSSGVIHGALEWLEEAGWVRAVPSREGKTKGRGRSDYLVNPRVQCL